MQILFLHCFIHKKSQRFKKDAISHLRRSFLLVLISILITDISACQWKGMIFVDPVIKNAKLKGWDVYISIALFLLVATEHGNEA